MKKKSFVILLTVLMLFALTACGGGSNSYSGSTASSPSASYASKGSYAAEDSAYWSEAAMAPEAPMEMQSSAGNGGNFRSDMPAGVKMIYTAHLELETTEYDKAREDVAALIRQLGGYLESQNSSNYSSGYRSCSYTVRVPAEQFDAFLHQIGTLCNVRYQSQTAEDVSEYYYDTESRLETAKIKLNRLQDLLAKAETMEDIITIENSISDVEYQIEALSGELRHYDALIGYSTIYVTLQEVYKVTEVETAPLTFGERMGSAFREGLRDFSDGLEDFAEWLAYSWLSILVFLLVLVVAIKLIKRLFRRGSAAEKREKKGLFRKKEKSAPEAPADNSAEETR